MLLSPRGRHRLTVCTLREIHAAFGRILSHAVDTFALLSAASEEEYGGHAFQQCNESEETLTARYRQGVAEIMKI